MIVRTHSEEETLAWASSFAKELNLGTCLLLVGDLGVGKTVIARGLAKGMGIETTIASPTFSIVHPYEIEGGMYYHFDLYRIEHMEELLEIGWSSMVDDPEAICLIEWPDRACGELPENAICIRVRKDLSQGEEYREIEIGGSFDDLIP